MMSSRSDLGSRELVFDLYGTLLDPLSISSHLTEACGDSALEVSRAWRQRQLEYSFRLTVMGTYRDFRFVSERSLRDTLNARAISVTDKWCSEVVDLYDSLDPYPDAASTLKALASQNRRLSVLSNGTPAMLRASLANSGLDEYFALVTSVDSIREFKPSRRVYEHAASELGVSIADTCLVSSNPFDIVGASLAGMGTTWINRSATVFDSLGSSPDRTVFSLADLVLIGSATTSQRQK